MYWWGIWAGAYYGNSALATLFLSIDRCVLLRFTLHPDRSRCIQTCLFWLSLIVLPGMYALYHAVSAMNNLPVDPVPVPGCAHLVCMLKSKGRIALQMRCSVEVVNVLASIYFFCLLPKKTSSVLNNVSWKFGFSMSMKSMSIRICRRHVW